MRRLAESKAQAAFSALAGRSVPRAEVRAAPRCSRPAPPAARRAPRAASRAPADTSEPPTRRFLALCR